MKPTQIKELRAQLTGSITDAADVREHFAHDASVLAVHPAAVAYPRTGADVAAIVAYAASQATKAGKHFSLTARGLGGGQNGGALGEGLIVVGATHLSRLINLGKDSVTVEAGMSVGGLQRVLHSHGRRLPLAPSADHQTVGGLIAGGGGGETAVKYGAPGDWVQRLRVVLDDGSVIQTKPLGRRELNRKKGLMTREGDLYRGVDGLLQDHKAVIKAAAAKTSRDTAAYRLTQVWQGSSFDLGQLMVGSEGTLGIITEVTLRTEPLAARTTLVVGCFSSLAAAAEAVERLQPLLPCSLELADQGLLDYLQTHQPHHLAKMVPEGVPQALVWAAFDNPSHLRQNLLARRAERIMRKLAATCTISTEPEKQEQLWAPRRAVAMALWTHGGTKKPLPIAGDISVPLDRLAELLTALAGITRKHKLEAVCWSHAGDAIIHLQPLIDLGKPKGRKTALGLMDDVFNLAIKYDGTIAATGGLGRLRAPYLEKQVGRELYQICKETKQLCDPHGLFNPQVKLGTTKKAVEAGLRHDYTPRHQYHNLPNL